MKRFVLFAALSLGLAVGEAQAGYVTMSMPQGALERTYAAGLNFVRTPLNSAENDWTVAGRYEFLVEPPPGAIPLGPLFTYCLDVTKLVQTNTASYEVRNVATQVGATKGVHLMQLVSAVTSAAGVDPWQFDGARDFRAWAFQLAVWEIAHETGAFAAYGSYDVADGNFSMLADARQDATERAKAINQANAWLDMLSSSTSQAGDLVALDPGVGHQAQTVLLPQERLPPVVPEPASLCIWAGLALVGCGVRYRRRKSQA